ncbi:hypothetical protein PTTG_28552 [Puccinia triticina 1-1 BBBD Race 1]|uniref:Uncharacterized protein n=1 Tax=Puccinia triticina (isolate 1-1 / race 1 (BBBD)) TaxID=630390 RepID=A0A180GCW3_PUCT1|nr:hypothetical protein PTTG_28552 [Puccinia triticina 1-1 BBBD Race 1]
MAQVRADSDASAEATAPEPDGPEERLHAICGRESAHGLKLLLKRAALFAANRALIHEALGAERRQTVFIPTTATRLADPTHRPPEILPVDHPAIPLPPSFIAAASALLRGFQWIPLAGQPSHRSASPLVRAVQAFFGAQAAERLADELPRWEQYDDLGLRRGAVLNRVPYEIVDPEAELTPDLLDASPARLLIFPAENARGLPLYRHRASHVNLGLLPSSLDFLPQAVLALRPEGGWIHIHAELAVPAGPPGRQHAAEQWAQQPRQLVLRLGRQSARVVDIHWIKSIGPAREHIVVELEVGPSKTST